MAFLRIVGFATSATFGAEATAVANASSGPPPPGSDVVVNGNCVTDKAYDSYWPTVSVQCKSVDCRAPRYWVVADGNGKANVWTTNDYNGAYNAVGGFSWWADYVTRELYDMNADELLEHKYSCTGADQELSNWLKESQNVNECRYAGGFWNRILTRLTPSSDWSWDQTVEIGYSRERANSVADSTTKVSVDARKEYFENTTTYSHVVQLTDSQTWSQSVTTTQGFSGKAGVSSVWWQYYLTCQGFNRQGLYVDKLQFATNIFKGTDSLTPPAENPPQYYEDIAV